MALAHLASTLLPRTSIHALIIDHLTRPTSTTDAQAASDFLAKRYGFTTHVFSLVPPHPSLPPLHHYPKTVFETVARQYRWHILSSECLKLHISHLLLAHHIDDQAETIVMRIVNGTAYAGAAGMKPVAKPPESRGVRGAVGLLSILRPFLVPDGPEGEDRIGIGKERLIATCLDAGVPWWEDPTNTDTSLTRRNAIRHLLQGDTTPAPPAINGPLPKALSRRSLVTFAWRIHSRIFLQDAAIGAKLHTLGGALVTICTFSGTARVTVPRWPLSDMHQDVPGLARALQKLADLLTHLPRPDAGTLRALAVPPLFFPETLRRSPAAFTAAGLFWTPESMAATDHSTWVLSRQPPKTRPPDPLPELTLSSASGEESGWRLFDGRFYFRRRWAPQCTDQAQTKILHPHMPPLKIRFMLQKEWAETRKSFCKLDPAATGEDEGWLSISGLLSSRLDGSTTLQPLGAPQVDILLGTAVKGTPAYARFAIPVAVVAEPSSESSESSLPTSPCFSPGEIVGFPSLRIWKRGVFTEIHNTSPPPPQQQEQEQEKQLHSLPPPVIVTGVVECVFRGWGEYIDEDEPSSGLGRGWTVEWISRQETALTPRRELVEEGSGRARIERGRWGERRGEGDGGSGEGRAWEGYEGGMRGV